MTDDVVEGRKGYRTRGVRYNRKARQFEMFCPDCSRKALGQTFWPITHEFWPRKHLARCLACELEMKREHMNALYAADRAAVNERNRVYYRENRALLRWKDNERKRLAKAGVP